ncbi:beta-galactosidase [Asticcacaulis sp. ZE23SCel15]|uniref:beta-galactosidase n=1 Tax=Asticcacaulis sp. ZE23SCel15 TaxID=3059027 RepID=UPI00265DF706|nr:beta-galactosidase [Asticcacaulis sp. ZE23SCel15]WKL57015.1 beta-galactosidase [Asticcacaulis sp. ZE23SCel15]
MKASAAISAMVWALAGGAFAETLTLDASTPPPAPVEGTLKMGAGRAPDGTVISVNNQYLMIGGKPVVPVMGEFHYSRFPRAYWEEQLLKMKSAGVNVIATYVIWQHHEEQAGQSDWDGDLDLRAFIELCHKHGLYAYLRPGPWVHAEVRFGGIPDWVVDSVPTRSNDPTYLSYVEAFYGKVAEQSKGLLWKDGGPVIGVQLENEYNRNGYLQGRDHISKLKEIALKVGLDVPLYSVTGWDNAVFPRGEVIPVFGSYVDEPWSASATILPPKSSYMFQFGVRNEKGLGAQGSTSTQDDGGRDTDITPFFGAEYGGGVPTMYRRRPIIKPDDISKMTLTKIGSGVNLMGYYMFQGGQNPPGSPTREETVATGGYNDMAKLGYDFQAPLGQYGQAHPVLNQLKPIHYFLEAFGDRVAPTHTYAPLTQPTGSDDLKTLRWSFRGNGQSGFVFVNNYIRQYDMAAHKDVRFEVKLAGKTITLPSQGVDIDNGDNFMWPVNFDLSGVNLVWATAQPITKITDGEGDLYIFASSGDIAPEFAFGSEVTVKGGKLKDGLRIVTAKAGTGAVIKAAANGKTARLMLLTPEQAKHLTKVDLGGRDHVVLSDAHVFGNDQGGFDLRQTGKADFNFSIYPTRDKAPNGNVALKTGKKDGIFTVYQAKLPAKTLTAELTPLRPAQKAPPLKTYGPRNTPVVPEPESFAASAAWTITVPSDALSGVADAYLDIAYQGDVARLFSGARLIDDEFYNGLTWRIGLKRYAGIIDKPLTLTIMPMREDSKVYLDASARPEFTDGQVAKVTSVTLTPEYGLTIRP